MLCGHFVEPMRWFLPVLLLLLPTVPRLAAADREGVPGNLAQLDSCARRLADTLLPMISEGDTLLLPPMLGETAPLVLDHLIASATSRGLGVSSGRCADAEPGIVSAQVLYHTEGTELVRESRLSLELVPRSRCAAPLSESRILVAVLRDTVAPHDTALLADPRVVATQGRLVEDDDGWLAPVLVIGAALLSTILLFTVRSP